MRRIVSLWSVVVLGCSSGNSGQSVVLGSAGPWTEGYGAANRHGIELARDEINAAGGIKGKKLEILFQDDSGSGVVAARIAQEFVDNPAVLAVVGHVSSGAMLAAARVYDGHLVAVATTASSPALTGISPWTFRVISSDSANGVQLAEAVYALGLKRAAILYANDGYGRGLSTSFRGAFKGQLIANDPIGGVIADAEPFIAYFRKVQPDVVLVAGTDSSGLIILREARRQQLEVQFVGGDGWTPVVDDTAASEGVLVGAPFTAEDPRPEARKFVKAFRVRYKVEPDGNAALGYDATLTLARAVGAVGADRDAIRRWLHTLDERRAVPGVSGPIRFRADGDRVGRGIVLTRARAGRLVVEKSP
ncbi:MAG: ABC transporter substrate-binding protein [Gemmatimonadota bacterium]